jgi:hypothetical protein
MLRIFELGVATLLDESLKWYNDQLVHFLFQTFGWWRFSKDIVTTRIINIIGIYYHKLLICIAEYHILWDQWWGVIVKNIKYGLTWQHEAKKRIGEFIKNRPMPNVTEQSWYGGQWSWSWWWGGGGKMRWLGGCVAGKWVSLRIIAWGLGCKFRGNSGRNFGSVPMLRLRFRSSASFWMTHFRTLAN